MDSRGYEILSAEEVEELKKVRAIQSVKSKLQGSIQGPAPMVTISSR